MITASSLCNPVAFVLIYDATELKALRPSFPSASNFDLQQREFTLGAAHAGAVLNTNRSVGLLSGLGVISVIVWTR